MIFMKPKYLILLSVMLLFFFQFSFTQVGVGQWQDHLPYGSGNYVTESNDYIYTATGEALFSYHKQSGETQRLTKINGLSDVGIQSIAYNLEFNILIIGYLNGNIDLLKDNRITNISDIYRKSIAADKQINHIHFMDEFAVLSTGFGIVLFDMERLEIKSTWFIADLGAYLNVLETDFDGQYIYAATENGIYKGDFVNDNLADFHRWDIITAIPFGEAFFELNGKYFNTLEYFNDKLIVCMHNQTQQNQDSLFVYQNNQWSSFSDTIITQCNYLSSNDEKLVVTRNYNVFVYDENLERLDNIFVYKIFSTGELITPNPAIAIPGMQDELIIADRKAGLVKHRSSWNDEQILLNGPQSSSVFDISSAGGQVWMVAGGRNLSWNPTYKPAEINVQTDNEWRSLNHENSEEISGFKDMVVVKVNPYNPSQVFAASWIHGIVEFINAEIVNTYDETNSSIQPVFEQSFIRIGGLDFDEDQNLWVINSGSSVPVHMRSPQGEWIELDYSSQIGEFNIGEILVTSNDHKWVILPRGGGLFVFDDNDTPEDLSDDRTRKLSVRDEFGKVISNEIFSIAEDKNGSIWLGTNVGVVVYYDPEDVFDENIVAHQVLIPRNDGTDNADILLGAETVTAICVDGANKKWFGTENGGVFKTSSDGVDEIYHFNEDNSPLFSNNILSMEINPETGEVFIGTNKGVLSYRGEATEGEDTYDQVYAFPNPVEHDYQGPITIHGLIAGSIVKITDISGKLVFETRSEGGQAIWYGNNLNGNRVHTGVYLVFSANEDGTQSNVTKILFIN
jgi:hypothetical protein